MAPKRLTDLSGEELASLLALIEESDSVELKLTVDDANQQATVRSLGIDPLDGQIRQVFFFDTPDLQLSKAGLVVRARRIQGRKHDSVVKLRPVVPHELPSGLRNSPALTVEVDAIPGGYVCSAALKSELGRKVVGQSVFGDAPLSAMFSKRQREFYSAHAPDGLELDDLAVLGPVFVLKAKTVPESFGRKLVAEVWLYPDGSRILELSTKCAPREAFQVAAEARAHLGQHGIDLTGEQQTKTRTALTYFSRELLGRS
jgi:hypothetical protein